MSWIALLVAGALVNLILAELLDWCPWVAVRLIRRAVRKLPPEARDRYLDEWLAELEAVPGRRISAIIFAIRICIGASRVSAELGGRSVVRDPVVRGLVDRVLVLLLVSLWSPLILTVALAVRLTSPGPVLVTQRRVGRGGVLFNLYSFRSTICAAESEIPAECRRFTPVGGLLHRTSLEELPQLFSVLRGDMSIVGPHPERPESADLFRQDVPGYDDRQRVKSGMTGWAQVHLCGNTDVVESVEWDNYYVEHRSLALDLKIILLTVYRTLGGNRSVRVTSGMFFMAAMVLGVLLVIASVVVAAK